MSNAVFANYRRNIEYSMYFTRKYQRSELVVDMRRRLLSLVRQIQHIYQRLSTRLC